jgi:hypothetical protein
MFGTGKAIGNAVSLAGAQLDTADAKTAEANGSNAPQRSRVGRAAAMTGYTARNVASSAMADIGRRLSGQHPRHGLMTWRMSADLANRARLLRHDFNKPAPPRNGDGNTIG